MKVYIVILVDEVEYIAIGGVFTSYEKAVEYAKTIKFRFDYYIEEHKIK